MLRAKSNCIEKRSVKKHTEEHHETLR